MIRKDGNYLPEVNGEIRLFAVMKNESFRLNFWLSHYRKLGVDRFFVLDNNSSDNTSEILLNQQDVHVYHSEADFQFSQSGRLWLSSLMMKHGVGFWCVVADADELLAYPHWETVSLKTLTGALDAQGHDVLECLLLDMYSEGPISETHYAADSDPFALCPWFDPDFTPIRGAVDHDDCHLEISTFVGSARQRVFGVNAFLSKIGLLRYQPEMLLTRGQHGVFGGHPSDMRGVMFHFKYFSSFPGEVERVMRRGERANCSAEWDAYYKAFALNPRLSLHGNRSIRLIDSKQLSEIGVMKTCESYERFIEKKAT